MRAAWSSVSMSASMNWVFWNPRWGAELLALLGVGDGLVEAALGAAEAAGADVDPAAVQTHHRDAEALALAADEVLGRHPDLVEIDLARGLRMPAELLLLRAEGDAFHVLFDHKAADPLGPVDSGADHGHVDLVLAAARDERLGARNDVIAAVFDRPRSARRRPSPSPARSGNRSRSAPSSPWWAGYFGLDRGAPKRSIIQAAMLWIEMKAEVEGQP